METNHIFSHQHENVLVYDKAQMKRVKHMNSKLANILIVVGILVLIAAVVANAYTTAQSDIIIPIDEEFYFQR